jgi:hypothetical protein
MSAESFFSSLKRERIRRRTYKTRDEARQDVFDYIEMFYNPVAALCLHRRAFKLAKESGGKRVGGTAAVGGLPHVVQRMKCGRQRPAAYAIRIRGGG